jgi:hypothetical protein
MKCIKTSLIISLFAVAMFLLSSCIELIQTIEINPDKSGKYSLKIDLGMLQNAGSSSLQDASGIITAIKSFPDTAVVKLSSMKGISGIENITKDKDGIYGIRFNFENAKSLNKAFYQLADQQKLFFMPDYIKIKRRKLIITDIGPYIKKASSMAEKSTTESFISDQISRLIQVTTNIYVPKPVKKVQNSRSRFSGQQVTFSMGLNELIEGKNYGNVIKF